MLEKSDYVLVMATDVVNNSTHDVTVLKVELVQGNKQLAMVRNVRVPARDTQGVSAFRWTS